jgi:hypothetical protein
MSVAPRTGFLGRELVWTPDGAVAIHAVRVGDVVLGRSAPAGRNNEVVPVRVVATHTLPATPLGVFDVSCVEEPDGTPTTLIVGARQTFWVQDSGWEWDFSGNADELEAFDGRRWIAYNADRILHTATSAAQSASGAAASAPDALATATLERYERSDSGTILRFDALGVIACNDVACLPAAAGTETVLSRPTFHLTVDSGHALYVTDAGLLAHDFTAGDPTAT